MTPTRGARPGAPPGIREHLEEVLAGPAFRGSKRCQQFLRFIVEHALDGRADDIKERTIGVEVFGRESSYQTSEDAIVRVKANEVRKRLAQHYQEAGTRSNLRIDLPAGSYVPDFHLVEEAVVPPSVPPRVHRWWLVAVAVLAVLGAVFAFSRLTGQKSAFDEFWAPVLASPRPVLLCLAQPPAYQLSRRLQNQILLQTPEQVNADDVHPSLAPGVSIASTDLVPITDLYVAEGDAMAAIRFTRILTRYGKPADVRIGNDITFPEMRDTAAILIGAFSNRWTLQMTRDLRYYFARDLTESGRLFQIRDRQSSRRWSLVDVYPAGKSPIDYSIVSRVFDSSTGKTLITVAGLTMSGTQSAAELLTDPQMFAAAIRNAPVNWEKRNLQIVLQTKVVGKNPGPPQVVATHVW